MTRHPITTVLSTVVAAILVLCGPVASPAAAADGDTGVEVFLGWMDPGPGLVDENPTAGVRWTDMLSERVGLQVSLGYFNGELDTPDVNDPVFDYSFDSESVFLDLGGVLDLAPRADISPKLVAGIGWAWVHVDEYADTVLPEDDLEGISKDSLTAHLGLFVTIDLGERLYLAPGIRGRWIENRADDEIDLQASVALGCRF